MEQEGCSTDRQAPQVSYISALGPLGAPTPALSAAGALSRDYPSLPILNGQEGEPSFRQLGALRESEAGQRAQSVSSHHSHTVQHESPHTQPGESYRLTDTPRTGHRVVGHRGLERGRRAKESTFWTVPQ